MSPRKTPDTIDWFGCLARSAQEARDLRADNSPAPREYPVCRCGTTEIYGRPLDRPVVDLREADVVLAPAASLRRCRACPHGIHHGAMSVQHHLGGTYVDHYHPACAVI